MEVFRWTPYSPPRLSESFRVTTSQFESGKTQRYYKGKAPRKWFLQFRLRILEMIEIRDFYRERKGAFEAFLWTEPHSGDLVTVRFSGDSLDIESQWKRNLETGALEVCFGTFAVTFEEVL